jgi:hypothetical protein
MFSGAYRGIQLSRLVMISFVLLPLAGCGGLAGGGSAGEAATTPNRPILDPIAAFAADPPTQGQGQVFLPDSNETATLRVARQYAAASGRECREVRVTQRSGDTLRLFCRAGAGWIEARPLMAQTVGR